MVATNEKLRRRAIEIISGEAALDLDRATEVFEAAGSDLRVALIMAKRSVAKEEAESLLNKHGGSLRRVLDE